MGTTADLAHAFRSADDAWLARLLLDRPDLARPSPGSLSALATRAGSRGSASRAIATLTAPELAALEAVVVLNEAGHAVEPSSVDAALGLGAAPLLDRLRGLALVLGAETLVPAPGVVEAVGDSPLALGPSLRTLGVRLDEGWPTTPAALAAVLDRGPQEARRLVDALAAGPAVGTLGTTVPAPARWLLDNHVLHRLSATEVVLPREVAIAARGGRLSPGVALHPPLATAAERSPEVVASEAAALAETSLRQVDQLLAGWAEDPPSVLRAGGLAARDVKRLAVELAESTTHATLIAEIAAMVGLVGQLQHDDGSVWAPTAAAEAWPERLIEDRWSAVVTAWIDSRRVPWLAGTRTERGALRAALDPELHRAWAPALRRRVLEAVAAWPDGSAPTGPQVRDRLLWHAPRSAPPQPTVDAVIAEASALGLLGAGALAAPARALLDGAGRSAVAAALRATFPPEVGDLVIQGDLTGIVPGRPTPQLADLLDASADVDSRGAALAVRFTASSIARALATGWSAADLLERLREASRSGVPQPLEYLVSDAARRHRRVRVQPATTVVVVDDEAAALALLSDPSLAELGLRRLGPTTLASDASPLSVHDAVRRAGAAPVLEGPDGRGVAVAGHRRRPARPVGLEGPPVESTAEPAAVVAAMRAGEARTAALLAGASEETSPVDDLDLLRAASAQGSLVRLVMAGPGGATQERVVRPLSVDGGRVRALDASREAEITVATHRIVGVRPA